MPVSAPPLSVRSGQGDYEVAFPGSIADLAAELAALESPAVVMDRRVAELHADALAPFLRGAAPLLVDATEETKTLSGVERLALHLQQRGAIRRTPLVAIGGGIVQDVATFTAHAYFRGIRWLFVPTTLLAMSDSCIGAKCGINLGAYKNQLGVFHSPARVLLSTEFLRTLSDTDVLSGHGEVLKLALTGGREDFERHRDALALSGPRGPELPDLVRRSLEVKRRVIEEDEYESGLRKILNYGHTYGHALEALTDHAIPHGLAVAWGLDLANYLAVKRGLLDPDVFREVHALVGSAFRFPALPRVGAAELVHALARDKKAIAGGVQLVLLREMGRLEIVPTSCDAALVAHVEEYLAEHDALRGA